MSEIIYDKNGIAIVSFCGPEFLKKEVGSRMKLSIHAMDSTLNAKEVDELIKVLKKWKSEK